MLDIKRFQQSTTRLSGVNLENACTVIENNLIEMGEIVSRILLNCPLAKDTGRRELLFLSSCFYDFYQLTEECLLKIASITDRWVPGSLDWHYRLIRLLEIPVPGVRPAVLTRRTASLLDDYLVLYRNYHQHSPAISAAKIEKMLCNLPEVYERLERELIFLNNLVMPGRRQG